MLGEAPAAVAAHQWRLTRVIMVALFINMLLPTGGCVALVAGGAGKPASYPEASRSTEQSTADAEISALIRSEFAADSYLQSQQVMVSTRNGLVTLTGRVSSFEARSQAEILAAGIKGVTGVHNKLQVANGY